MNHFYLIIAGVVIGLIAAAPIGPVNLICIRRTLAFGTVNGFIAGLGAALGDALFAAITAFGLTAIMDIIRGYSTYLQVGGGILLIAFGIHTYLTLPDPTQPREKRSLSDSEKASLVRVIVSTFALTMTNPATMFGFAAMFASLSAVANVHADYLDAAIIVGGVACGSTLWWFTLTSTIGFFHAKIDAATMKVINHGSGVVVGLFGIAVLGHVILKLLNLWPA
jgi:threonine/homoserine/homoserine lactone efflux protein